MCVADLHAGETKTETFVQAENIQEKSLPGDGENTNLLIHKREREGEGVTGATAGRGGSGRGFLRSPVGLPSRALFWIDL